MEIVGFTLSEFWATRNKRLGPGTIRVWMALEYEGIESARAKAVEHLDFLKEHFPDKNPLLVELYAENQGWETKE